ncbi:hypothetical protein [Armatimonas sp.]|uniref:hypothetical protein n=1 Tax=Armatimonas sp. TaxID=1872638 RepID=UPI00286CB21C|nr:hypothetical protein [Armatimonas sp.]
MKRQQFFTTTLAALTALSLFGCSGGGGNSGSNSTDATRELLAGKGTAASPTIFYWRTASLKANTTYYNATGGDQPCPVTITSKSGSADGLGCSEDQVDAYRSDGKILYDVSGTPNWSTSTDSFTVNGSEVTITNGDTAEPTDTRTIVAEVISESSDKIRLRIKRETLVNGTNRPNNVGLEVVFQAVS